MSEVLLKIGRKIQNIRFAEKISQEELAYRAGMHTSYLSNIENGKRNVSAINLCKIAKALNKEVGDLFPSIKSICF